MEIIEILTALGIACFSVLITGYIGIRYIKNSHFFEDVITNGIINVINDAQNDESLQKNLYSIGALLGNGIANGSGMLNKAKGSGKFNLNSFLAETVASYIQSKPILPSPSSYQSTPSPSPTDLTIRKPSNKW